MLRAALDAANRALSDKQAELRSFQRQLLLDQQAARDMDATAPAGDFDQLWVQQRISALITAMPPQTALLNLYQKIGGEIEQIRITSGEVTAAEAAQITAQANYNAAGCQQ